MNGFIVSALDKKGDSYYFISNTNPILWTDDKNKAKVFKSYSNTVYELEDNFISLTGTINYTNVTSIVILEYVNDVEVGRCKFL